MTIFPKKRILLSLYLVIFSSFFNIVNANPVKAGGAEVSGLGIIPALSDHYSIKPVHYDFNAMPVDQKTNNIGLRFVMGTKTTLIKWHLKKTGTKLPLHFHPNEQINFVEQGKIEVFSQGQKYVLAKGQVMIFPPNVPHEFVALEDNTIMVDIQTPARQEFVNGEFDKIAKKIFT